MFARFVYHIIKEHFVVVVVIVYEEERKKKRSVISVHRTNYSRIFNKKNKINDAEKVLEN